MSKLFSLVQYFLPQHLITKIMGVFAESKSAKNFLIRLFIKKYNVDMTEARNTCIDQYPILMLFSPANCARAHDRLTITQQ